MFLMKPVPFKIPLRGASRRAHDDKNVKIRAHPRNAVRLDNLVLVGLHDNREEHARLAARGDHTVAASRIVHEQVTRLELLDMVLVGEAHLARDDVIELLALMVRKVDGLILLLGDIRRRDEEGARQAYGGNAGAL